KRAEPSLVYQPAVGIEERVRPLIIAYHRRVGDELAAIPPMQHEARWLHAEAARRILVDVERHLMRRARAGQSRSAADTGVDHAVQVTAQDQPYLLMPSHDLCEAVAALEA